MKRILLLAPVLGFAACTITPQPVVTEYNGDSVTIHTTTLADRNQALAAATQEANRICQQGSGKNAQLLSTRTDFDAYLNYDLFACLDS